MKDFDWFHPYTTRHWSINEYTDFILTTNCVVKLHLKLQKKSFSMAWKSIYILNLFLQEDQQVAGMLKFIEVFHVIVGEPKWSYT